MTSHIDMINNTITVDLNGYLALGIIALFAVLFLIILVFDAVRMQRLLDRYRQKYSFDRDIERKEMDNPTDSKLSRREERFKRRVFKD